MTHCGWNIFVDNDKLIAKKWGARMSVDINDNIQSAKQKLFDSIKLMRDKQISLKEKDYPMTQKEIQLAAGTPLPVSIVVDYANNTNKYEHRRSPKFVALFICTKCDNVWASDWSCTKRTEKNPGFEYYPGLPKCQHKKICPRCRPTHDQNEYNKLYLKSRAKRYRKGLK